MWRTERAAALAAVLALCLAGCARLSEVGRAPAFSEAHAGPESAAMMLPGGSALPAVPPRRAQRASLWSDGQGSLLSAPRAQTPGDILTVVIELDDSASISNSTSRSRSGSENLSVPDFAGIPQRLQRELPPGASFSPAVSTSQQSASEGDGAVRRREELTLRVAATVTGVLPNGVLVIEGRQEVRVNFELRELLVNGYVRPEDISRRNEITHDKIAAARISYGGRGQITDMQQPRYGQQIADAVLPF